MKRGNKVKLFFQENERSKDIIIDHKFHKNIIGAGGETIKEIKKKFEDVSEPKY